MIPILYDAAETSFASNGICRLYEITKCQVIEERNGIYECDFEYPVNGANFDKIQCGRIIYCWHDDTKTAQPFDIVSYSKPIDGVVTFHAVHISYRQSGMVAHGTNINSLADALTMLKTAEPENPFIYETNITSSAYMASADGTPRTVRQLLGGVDGSILDTYGGEYEFDKFRVILHQQRGKKRDFTIRYGVNMLDYKDDTDFLGSYSSCIPFWKGNENGADVVVIGDRVDTGAVTYNQRNDCAPLDLSDKFETKPTKVAVEAMATQVMTAKRPYNPSQSINVDFVRLQDLGYDVMDGLLQCNLCDTINVVFPQYGMAGSLKIVKTVYDALEERYVGMELGTLAVTLSEALGITNGLDTTSGGGSADVNFDIPGSASWTTLNNTWAPSKAGVATVRINPSNTSACYVQLTDTNNNNVIVCQVFTTAGAAMSGCFPVIAGHTYKVNAKSSNISTFEVYHYQFS